MFGVRALGLTFSQCSTTIFQAIEIQREFSDMNGVVHRVMNALVSLKFCQTKFSRLFNFAILCYSRNSRKFDAREKYVFYNIL